MRDGDESVRSESMRRAAENLGLVRRWRDQFSSEHCLVFEGASGGAESMLDLTDALAGVR
jgi:hypothetical protein